MSIKYLSLYQVSERLGIKEGTIRSYLAKGMLPEPDALTGPEHRAVRGWLPDTIDAWNATRPGHGGRKPKTV